jgi:hypothetical protein
VPHYAVLCIRGATSRERRRARGGEAQIAYKGAVGIERRRSLRRTTPGSTLSGLCQAMRNIGRRPVLQSGAIGDERTGHAGRDQGQRSRRTNSSGGFCESVRFAAHCGAEAVLALSRSAQLAREEKRRQFDASGLVPQQGLRNRCKQRSLADVLKNQLDQEPFVDQTASDLEVFKKSLGRTGTKRFSAAAIPTTPQLRPRASIETTR